MEIPLLFTTLFIIVLIGLIKYVINKTDTIEIINIPIQDHEYTKEELESFKETNIDKD